MNPDLHRLQPYPFERLARLKRDVSPPTGLEHINLSIGEPQHPAPHFISEALTAHLHGLGNYPTTRGFDELRAAQARWLERRFVLPGGAVDAHRQVLPVNGTREALFALAQCVVDRASQPRVLMPNPFYQIYEGAALLAGAEPYFLNATGASGHLPDFAAVPEAVWQSCQLLYVCSPANPSGYVLSLADYQNLLERADRYDFVIASDECYTELYADESAPPPGLLQAAYASGREDFRRCVVFHSLSKRSNVPGLRSGFVAGDAGLIRDFLLYRTYHGSAMPPATQHASLAAWRDETHVIANRLAYREKFAAVHAVLGEILDLSIPPAGFYFWFPTPGDDEAFVRDLFAGRHVTLLPGSYLSRESGGLNPGRGWARMALVPERDACVEAAQRIAAFVTHTST